MQRILSVYDWQLLPEGSQFSVSSDIDHQRSVRLRVNAPMPMALYINQAELDAPVLLAHVVGLDEIQFEVLGDYVVMADQGDCFFDTLDGTKPFVESVDNESFTQIVERRVRNPELELIERRMQENMERRMALMAAEVAQITAQQQANREAAYAEARAAVDTRTAPAGTVPGEPTSPDQSTTSDASASTAGAGTKEGTDDAAS